MDVLVLNRPVKGIHSLDVSNRDTGSLINDDHELDLIMGNTYGSESRDRELKAYADRIKILEAELQKARAEAYQAGFQEGQKIARAEAKKQFSELSKEFTLNIKGIHTEFTSTIEQLTEPLVNLALHTAKLLIERELTLAERADEILLTQIKRVLSETISQSQAMLQVNPTQIDYITKEDILAKLNYPQKANLKFTPNPNLQPGECKLETEAFLVDSTIKAQLENIRLALLDTDAAYSD